MTPSHEMAPDSETGARLIARNSVAGVIRYAISIPLFLVTVPLILAPLGADRFAIWALVGVITAYAGLADLGISSGLVRFAAQAHAVRDSDYLSSVLSTVFAIYIVLGGATSCLLVALARPIVQVVLRIPEELQSEAVVVIWGAAAAVFLSLVLGVFGSLLQGTQRLDLWNLTLLIDTVVTGLGSVAVVRSGFGLPGLVGVRIASTSIAGLLSAFFALRVVPQIRIRPSLVSASTRRAVIRYSANILVSRVAILASEPLVRVFLARFASLASVTPFDIASRTVAQIRGVFAVMLIPLLPASSSLQACGRPDKISSLYERSTRVAAISTLPAFAGLAAFSRPLMLLWLRPGDGVAAATILLLTAVAATALLTTPAYTILEGTGHARWNALTATVASFLSVLLSVCLGLTHGYWGVVLGYALASLIGFAGTLVAFHRCLRVPLRVSRRAISLRLPLICVLVAVLTLAAQTAYPVDGVLFLFLEMALFYGFLAAALLLTRSVSIVEIRALLTLARRSVTPHAARIGPQ